MPVAECLVCGTAIHEAPRLCPKCDTPHHPDCWTYTGRCSVYGCGGGEVTIAVAEAPSSATVFLAAEVAVAGSFRPGDVWHTDANGAWIGRPDPTIPVLPGEHVVMLPPAAARRVLGEEKPALELAAVALVIGALPAMFYLSSGVAALVAGSLVTALLVKVHALASAPVTDLAWLQHGFRGIRLCTVSQGKQREQYLRPGLAPVAVLLSRSYQDAADGSGGTLMTYELSLVFPPDLPHRSEQMRVPLAPPLQMPDRAPERRPLLEHLVARRTLGHHVADMLQLRFEEGASR